MNFLKIWIIGNKNTAKFNGFLWNMIASVTTAISSFLMVIIITNLLGLTFSGYYSLAVAVSNLAYIMGTYSVLNYQITDVNEVYTFSNYYSLRLLTSTVMLLTCLLYTGITGDFSEKNLLIFCLCVYRAVDGVSEVYQGNQQQKNRMDIASKLNFCRQFFPDFFVALFIFFLKSLLIPFLIGTSVKIVIIYLFNKETINVFCAPSFIWDNFSFKKILSTCFPFFISSFLLTYVSSAPKFTIDRWMDSRTQAVYSILFLPTMVIHLFSGIIYRPMLAEMAENWNHGGFSYIKKTILNISLLTFILTLLIVFLGYFIGIPILSLLYGVDLSIYRFEFVLLLIAGGFSAISTFLSYIITIIRQQKYLIFIYAVSALLLLMMLPFAVKKNGIQGVTVLYLSILFFQTTLFFLTTAYYFQKIFKKE